MEAPRRTPASSRIHRHLTIGRPWCLSRMAMVPSSSGIVLDVWGQDGCRMRFAVVLLLDGPRVWPCFHKKIRLKSRVVEAKEGRGSFVSDQEKS